MSLFLLDSHLISTVSNVNLSHSSNGGGGGQNANKVGGKVCFYNKIDMNDN